MADDSEAIKCAICGELIGSQAGNPAVSATESETDSAGGQATDSPQLNDVDSSREASRQANYGKRGQQRKSFADAISELRRKWGRRGIVEIDKSHSRYALTRCIQQGLQESFKNCEVKEDASLQTGLTEEDFATVDVFQLTAENKKKFEFRTYAPKIFSRLRQVIGLSEKEYQSSLVPSKSLPYLEFISNSKSGMSFFLCNNKMMMIKTEKPKDVKFFRSILKTYLNHFEKYPHTLLVKILGLHYIHIPGHKARFFTIMLSVFYPDDRIVERYDLKGCHAARYTEPEPDGSQIIAILKDNNFKNKRINLGTQRQWFVDQVRHDTIFLEDIGVMDYSLLLGRHIIHSDERCQEDKFADVVIRVTKSVPLKKFQTAVSQVFCEACQLRRKKSLTNSAQGQRSAGGSQHGEHVDVEDGVEAIGSAPHGADGLNNQSGKQTQTQGDELKYTVLPGMIPGTPQNAAAPNRESTNNDSGLSKIDFDEVKNKNQRLLPLIPNALHVIDGESERYFVGIIDIFTQYKAKKKLEHVYKVFRFPCTSFSTVSPKKYSQRFRDFCDKHTI